MFSTAMVHVNNLVNVGMQGGVLDWVDEKSSAAQNTIRGLLIVIGLIVAIIIAWRGKTVGSVIMAIVVGGLIASLPALIAFFGGKTAEETNASAPTQVITQEAPAAPELL